MPERRNGNSFQESIGFYVQYHKKNGAALDNLCLLCYHLKQCYATLF